MENKFSLSVAVRDSNIITFYMAGKGIYDLFIKSALDIVNFISSKKSLDTLFGNSNDEFLYINKDYSYILSFSVRFPNKEELNKFYQTYIESLI